MSKPTPEFVSKSVPLYYQLENILREKIMSGAFPSGARLPTESELIRLYGVGRITVRHALAALVKDGLIERRRRRGTYVTERKNKRRGFEERIDLTGSLDEIIAAESEKRFKVIELVRFEADTQEADLLGLGAGDPLYRLKRIGFRDGNPYNLTLDYLPAEIGEKLVVEELTIGSLLQTLETKFGLKLKGATQRITATLADTYIAKSLEVRVGSPVLSIERAIHSGDDLPIVFSQTYYAADQSFAIRLTRPTTIPEETKAKKKKPEPKATAKKKRFAN